MTRFLVPSLALSALLLVGLVPARAQSNSDLKAEIEALKADHESMKGDLAKVREILEAANLPQKPKPFEPLDITLKGSPTKGDLNAKVTLVEFTDYQCPFCSRHKRQTSPQIISNYVETGKVRYILREYPLTSIHPRAAKASEAALCAGEQSNDKYWEMHEKLFANQKKLSDIDIAGYADEIGLAKPAFQTCFESGKYADKVKLDLQEGAKAGIRGTPSFLLGLTDPSNPDKLTATKYLRGAQPYASFQKAIDELLNSADAKSDD